MTVAPEHDLISAAKLCELFQRSPAQVERAVQASGVKVALRLNGICYFADSDLDAIRGALNAPEKRSRR